jgi:hypothetical protein
VSVFSLLNSILQEVLREFINFTQQMAKEIETKHETWNSSFIYFYMFSFFFHLLQFQFIRLIENCLWHMLRIVSRQASKKKQHIKLSKM